MKTENHIGKELAFNKTGFNREVAGYKGYVERIGEYPGILKEMGMAPLTTGRINRIYVGDFSHYLDEYDKLVAEQRENVPILLRPLTEGQIQASRAKIIKVLDGLREKLRGYEEQLDFPFIEGEPVLTPKFEEEVRERHVMRIKTEEGSDYYSKFLHAQEAVKDLMSTGASWGLHFELDSEEGIRLLNIYE